MPFADAVKQAALKCQLTGNGRDQLDFSASNPAATVLRIEIPAGLVCKEAGAGGKVVILRGAQLEVAPHGTADAQIPTAAISAASAQVNRARFEPVAGAEAKLEPLLKYLSTRTDVPRETSQLMVFVLLENITFAQWQHFLAAKQPSEPPGQAHPTPAEITQAIDALGVLREIVPTQTFALGSDAELKLRALRNPWCRPKAMQLYGMTIPGDAPPGVIPPDLSQLLHTKEGDNCPICRMRAQMQGPPSDL